VLDSGVKASPRSGEEPQAHTDRKADVDDAAINKIDHAPTKQQMDEARGLFGADAKEGKVIAGPEAEAWIQTFAGLSQDELGELLVAGRVIVTSGGAKRQVTVSGDAQRGFVRALMVKRMNAAELKWYQSKLTDPAFVFGKGVAVEWSDKDHQHATHWKSKYDASQIPLMQVLEHGTVRDDAMPESPAGGGKKKIYNGEVIATLARFGWSPGAAFGDTMHFDFVEGYNKAVPGGRNGENIKPTRYSPEGAMHDTDPAKK